MVLPYLTTQGTQSRKGSPLPNYPRYLEQEWFSPVLLPKVLGAGMVLPCPTTRGTWSRKDSPLSYYPRYMQVGIVLPCPATRGTWSRKYVPNSFLPRYLEQECFSLVLLLWVPRVGMLLNPVETMQNWIIFNLSRITRNKQKMFYTIRLSVRL